MHINVGAHCSATPLLAISISSCVRVPRETTVCRKILRERERDERETEKVTERKSKRERERKRESHTSEAIRFVLSASARVFEISKARQR